MKSGRSTITFIDGGLPVLGIVSPMSSQSTTLITGRNAPGEVIPPHIQFYSSAKSDDKERIWIQIVIFDDGKSAPFYQPWTVDEDIKLTWLKTDPIYI